MAGHAVLHPAPLALTDAWIDRREEVRGRIDGGRIREEAPAGNTLQGRGGGRLRRSRRRRQAGREFDQSAAGSAPRRSSRRRWSWSSCCAHQARTGSAQGDREMVSATCHAMAAAGCTTSSPAASRATASTADWVVPHFEKMLYDNALLLRVYLHRWWRRPATRSPGAWSPRRRRVPADRPAHARGRLRLGARRRLRRVGRASCYVWTPRQLVDVLGEDDGAWAASDLSVTERGTFEHGSSVLQLRRIPDDAAALVRPRARTRCSRRAALAASRRATTRSSRRGTAGHRRAGRGWGAARRARRGSRLPSGSAELLAAVSTTSRRVGLDRTPRRPLVEGRAGAPGFPRNDSA
jgi:uncharacterized protein